MKNALDRPKTISLTVPHEFHFCTDTRVRAHELDSITEASDKVGNNFSHTYYQCLQSVRTVFLIHRVVSFKLHGLTSSVYLRADTAKMSLCTRSEGSVSVRIHGRANSEVPAEDPRALSRYANWQLSCSGD